GENLGKGELNDELDERGNDDCVDRGGVSGGRGGGGGDDLQWPGPASQARKAWRQNDPTLLSAALFSACC
ncbi:MAG: hypothetical protein ACC642_03995, partial [Pseudomonadales bacterium]